MLQRSPTFFFARAEHARARRHAARSSTSPTSGPTRSCAAQILTDATSWSRDVARARPTSCTQFLIEAIAPAAARGLRRRQALQPALPPVAAAHRRRPRRRPVHRPARGQGLRSSPTRSRRSPRRASGSAPARSSRPTSSSPPPASTCRVFGDVAFTVDGEPVDFTAARHLARHHDQRRAEHGLRVRLLPAQLDAARRPGQRLRVPAARRTWRSRDATIGRPDAAARGRRHAAAPVVGPGELQPRLRHALPAPCCSSRATASRGRTCWSTTEERELLPKADLDDGSLVYRR